MMLGTINIKQKRNPVFRCRDQCRYCKQRDSPVGWNVIHTKFHARMVHRKFGGPFLQSMYPERYLFLKGNLTGKRHICNFIGELVARGPTDVIFLTTSTQCGLFDVSEMSSRLQNIYSLSWWACDSFYLLTTVIAMQTFCANLSSDSSCSVLLTDTWPVICLKQHHFWYEHWEVACFEYALWSHTYWHVLMVFLSPSNKMLGKINPRIRMFLEKPI